MTNYSSICQNKTVLNDVLMSFTNVVMSQSTNSVSVCRGWIRKPVRDALLPASGCLACGRQSAWVFYLWQMPWHLYPGQEHWSRLVAVMVPVFHHSLAKACR